MFEIPSRRWIKFEVRNRTLRVGVTALRKSLIDSIEIALIQLQYALADYYCRFESDVAVDSGALETPLRELRNRAISTQIAIDHARAEPQTRSLS
jgi:hypothetical protein